MMLSKEMPFQNLTIRINSIGYIKFTKSLLTQIELWSHDEMVSQGSNDPLIVCMVDHDAGQNQNVWLMHDGDDE